MIRSFAASLMCLVMATPVQAGIEEALLAYSQRDYALALQEFQPLALQGDSIAQFRIGFMYFHGQGVRQDYSEALAWYKKSAKNGNAEALYSIARMYNDGVGVRRNYVEAMEWYRQAAELGHGQAQAQLGVMYFVGMHVSRDYIEAFKWLNIAASLGIEVAPKYSDIVARQMSELQIDEAQRLANRWLEEHLKPQ